MTKLIGTLFFASFLTFASTLAHAQTLQPQKVDANGLTQITYVCDVILIAEDVPNGSTEWKFEADLKSEGSHGGEPRTFTSGAHEINVIADGTWLGVAWAQNSKKIAQGLFVMGSLDRAMHRVGILYDPSENGAQVSLSCSEGAL